MAESRAFQHGVYAGMLAMLGAFAVHWLITPMQHPDASALEHAAALAQVAGGFGGALWLGWRQRRSEARRRAPAADFTDS